MCERAERHLHIIGCVRTEVDGVHGRRHYQLDQRAQQVSGQDRAFLVETELHGRSLYTWEPFALHVRLMDSNHGPGTHQR